MSLFRPNGLPAGAAGPGDTGRVGPGSVHEPVDGHAGVGAGGGQQGSRGVERYGAYALPVARRVRRPARGRDAGAGGRRGRQAAERGALAQVPGADGAVGAARGAVKARWVRRQRGGRPAGPVRAQDQGGGAAGAQVKEADGAVLVRGERGRQQRVRHHPVRLGRRPRPQREEGGGGGGRAGRGGGGGGARGRGGGGEVGGRGGEEGREARVEVDDGNDAVGVSRHGLRRRRARPAL
jgi:translation initiation factor IF-2